MLLMRRIGNAKPLLVIAAVMRSRDSLIVPSGSPAMVRCFQTAQLSPTAMGCSTALLLHLDGMRMDAEHGGGKGLGEHRAEIPREDVSSEGST